MSGICWSESLGGENCLLLASYLSLLQPSVDFSTYYIIMDIVVENALTCIVFW